MLAGSRHHVFNRLISRITTTFLPFLPRPPRANHQRIERKNLGGESACGLYRIAFCQMERGLDIAWRRELAGPLNPLHTRPKVTKVQRLAQPTRNVSWLLTGVTNELKCLSPVPIGSSLGTAPGRSVTTSRVLLGALDASNIKDRPFAVGLRDQSWESRRTGSADQIFFNHPGEPSHAPTGTPTKFLNPTVAREVFPQAAGIGTQSPGQPPKRASLHRAEERAGETHRVPQRN
jgi:hypothetical protein